MKRPAIILLLVAALFPLAVSAQGISQLQQFTSTTSPAAAITQTVFGKAFRLTGQGSGCAQFSANGTLTSTGVACGSGSGGSNFSYPFPSNATTTNITFSNGLTGALTGNADTATALAANGTNCTAGNYARGVDASGNAENCTADANTTYTATYPITLTSTAFGLAFGTTTSNTWAGTQTFTNLITGSVSGNAGTATALTANGTNCSAGNYPLGVDASGNVEGCTTAAVGTVTSVTATNPLFSTGGAAPNISTLFSTTSTWGLGNNGFVITGATGIPFTAASSSLNLPNTALQNSSVTVNTSAPLGGGGAVSLGGTLTLTCSSCSTFAYPFSPQTYFGATYQATSSNLMASSSVFINATTTNATTTNLYASGQTRIASLSGLLLGTSGVVSTYGGASACSANNFVTTISSVGGTTCGTATISGVSLGSNLFSHTVSADFTGTAYNGSAAVSDWLLKMSQPHDWTGLQTFANASSTQFSAASQNFYIDSNGHMQAKDTVNGWTGALSPTHSLVLGTGTTTTWTASTTGTGYSPFVVAPFAGTLRQVRCATDASFVGVNVQIAGSNVTPSYFVASTTVGLEKITSGNTFTAGQKILANFGTTTTASTLSVNCTFDLTETF
jgi:hypothetical protein